MRNCRETIKYGVDVANLLEHMVRRTAELFLSDEDDNEVLLAKYGINGFWSDKHFEQHEKVKNALIENKIEIPEWLEEFSIKQHAVSYQDGKEMKYFDNEDEAKLFADENKGYYMFPVREPRKNINHRRMSNNSVGFTKKPTRKRLNLQFEMLKGEGEPAFVNLEEGARRVLAQLGDFNPTRLRLVQIMEQIGLNPCVEIILFSKNVCNLTTVNVKAFVEEINGENFLNVKELIEAQRLSARIGLRMTLAKLELEEWDEVQKRDRLLGCSLTGWKDAMDMIDYTEQEENNLKEILHKVAREEADLYSKQLRVNAPLLVTAVKPEGTLSQVAGGVSSGLHWSHSPHYIRRVRINSTDPLVSTVKELGWTVNPEVGTEGETFEDRMNNAETLVVDFPVKTGASRTKDDITVDEQFDNYFSFQDNYTEHNTSNTITVKPNEWDRAEERVWKGWNNFVGVSFLAHDGGTYQLAPYEACSEEDYNKLKDSMKPFDTTVLQKYEVGSVEDLDIGNDGCSTGICPVR